MKKQKITSAIRKRICKDDQATAYSVNKREMLDLIKEKMLDQLTENERKQLAKPFRFFKVCTLERENEFRFMSWINPNLLFSHYKVRLFVENVVYALNIPWLCAGSFKKSLKNLLK